MISMPYRVNRTKSNSLFQNKIITQSGLFENDREPEVLQPRASTNMRSARISKDKIQATERIKLSELFGILARHISCINTTKIATSLKVSVILKF